MTTEGAMLQREKIFPYLLMSLSKGPEHEEAEDIHAGFKELLSAINKPRNTYLLKSANQLFEEKTYPLLPVS